METPGTCAVCGSADGSLAPYRGVARANGWPHEYAHLDCARYRVSTAPLYRWRRIAFGADPTVTEWYRMEEIAPGLYAYVYRTEEA